MNVEQEFYERIWKNVGNWENTGGAYRVKAPLPFLFDFLAYLEDGGFFSDLSKEKENISLLDIGCGGGRNIIPFLKKGVTCTGIDFSQSAISLAKTLMKQKELEAEFIVGNFLNAPLAKRYEIILDLGCLHHIHREDWANYVKKIHSLLEPDGVLYVHALSNSSKNIRGKTDDQNFYFEDGHYTHFFTKDELLLLFTNFEILEIFEESMGRTKKVWNVYFKKKK